jgi:hypothetical protein
MDIAVNKKLKEVVSLHACDYVANEVAAVLAVNREAVPSVNVTLRMLQQRATREQRCTLSASSGSKGSGQRGSEHSQEPGTRPLLQNTRHRPHIGLILLFTRCIYANGVATRSRKGPKRLLEGTGHSTLDFDVTVSLLGRLWPFFGSFSIIHFFTQCYNII